MLGRRLEGVWDQEADAEVGEEHLLFPLLEREGRCIGDTEVRGAGRMQSEDTGAVVGRHLEYLISVGCFSPPRHRKRR